MYDNETRDQFVELRAQGLSLDAISAQLSVSKTTLGRWHHESLEQIQRLRALQWHLLEDQIGERLEDTLRHIAQRIRKWDNKLDQQLDVYQKPGDSIRVIRESRREYLQLRAILLAPLQPARRNAPCLTSVDSEKRDTRAARAGARGVRRSRKPQAECLGKARVKTGQTPDALETTPLPPNDLQQTEPSMSHFPVAAEVTRGLTSLASSPLNHNHTLNHNPDPSSASPRLCGEPPDTQPLINTPLQRGEPIQPPAAPTASAVYPGCQGEPIPPVSGGASSVEPATPAAESSDIIIVSNGSPALPLPGGEGQGEGQTGSSLNPQPSTLPPLRLRSRRIQ